MANETGWIDPVVKEPCGARRWYHTCIYEKGHTQDHGDKNGSWKKGDCQHPQIFPAGRCITCGYNPVDGTFP